MHPELEAVCARGRVGVGTRINTSSGNVNPPKLPVCSSLPKTEWSCLTCHGHKAIMVLQSFYSPCDSSRCISGAFMPRIFQNLLECSGNSVILVLMMARQQFVLFEKWL
uniref:Uncharacterized protein n=1 Tax=Sphaerodactylus townsendi TaxID=933632 RepID=A0ACB8F5B1_9SAUR